MLLEDNIKITPPQRELFFIKLGVLSAGQSMYGLNKLWFGGYDNIIELTKSESNVHFIDITHTNTNISPGVNHILFSEQDILDILEDGFIIGYLDVTVSGQVSSTSSNGGACGLLMVDTYSSATKGNPSWHTSKGSTTYTDHFTRVQIISNERYLAPRIDKYRYGVSYTTTDNSIIIATVSSGSCTYNLSYVSCRIYGLCIS